MDAWFIVVEGKPEGPFTFGQLQQQEIEATTSIKSTTMDDYKEAHEIPEIRKLLGFKHTLALPQYYASLDLRLLASFIDYFLISGIYAILFLLIISFLSSANLRIAVALSGLVLVPLSKFIYACFMESSERQGSFGKFWLGLKVTDELGMPLNFAKALARNTAKLLSKLTLGLGYLIGFFNKKQQCLHDQIVGTLVIRARLI